jgi:tRNA-uridine 2-sulfurtransferase
MRVVIAMSGGVDSSVAAALLSEAGHDVVGISMQLYDQRQGDVRFGSCCTIDDLHDARRVAAALHLPHYIVNFERQFDEQVLSNFLREYVSGRTPIPCVRCNSDLKFATLLDRALGLGAEYVATGHYARVESDPASGRYLLRRGLDPTKDQSYFLFSLTQDQLHRAMFPIGGWQKEAVRSYARARGLPVSEKAESQELCFVPAGEHASFVERRVPDVSRGGAIRDTAGRTVGHHQGIHRFTVGQRKGLGLSAAVPLYVVEIQAEHDTVIVGPREALDRRRLSAQGVNWIACDPPVRPRSVTAQIRYRHRQAPATVVALDDRRAEVEFETPQSAVAPGQAVVFYDGETVVGGGWIE